MKIRSALAFAALTAAVSGPAFAFGPTVIVGNIYDTIVKEPLEVKRWTDNMKMLTDQLKQAQQIYKQTKTVADFIGDPKASVQDLRNISQIANTLGRITGSDTTFAGQMGEVGKAGNDWNALFDASSDLSKTVGDSIKLGSQTQKRDVNLYEALAASERLANTTRDAIKKDALREEDAQKRIDKTIEDLLNKPNPTQTEIQTALVSLQREQLLAMSAAQRQQTMLAMQELERRAAEARAQQAQQALTEGMAARSIAVGDAATAAQDNSRAATQQALTVVQPAPIDNSAIRTWVPTGK